MSDWIFFDCFNTLIDDFDEAGDESGLGSLPDLARTLGACRRREDFVAAWHLVRQAPDDPYREVTLDTRLLLATLHCGHLDADRARVAAADLLDHWHTEYPPSLRLTPGVQEMLAFWQGKKRLAVVSNFYVPNYPSAYLKRFGILHHFEFVLDSAAFGYKKPSPRIFQEALRRASTEAKRVIFIGDRIDLDIEPAHALGMYPIHLDRSACRSNAKKAPAKFATLASWGAFR